MKHVITVLLAAALFLLAGCAPSPDSSMRRIRRQPAVEAPRFEIKLIEVIDDDLAYRDRRGIYLIKDTQTGKEFIGLSGIGVSELGSHQAGKTRISDER